MSDNTPLRPGGDIHRLLDQAFAGVDMTADAQDLKEEVRANLVARVSELEAAGRSSDDAARRAIDELGDVRELLDAAPGASASAPRSIAAEMQRNRVRPKPGFVVRVTVAAVIATGALVTAVLGAVAVLPLPVGVTIALLALGASAAGWIVGDALSQETTTDHRMPQGRAGGYYLASALMIFGLGFAGLVVAAAVPVWAVVFAAVAVVAAISLFAFLGATQTNRRKAWVVALQADQHAGVGDRFEREPEAAARFGIYTVVIWVVAFAVFLVLSFTIGWAWSWLALLGGFALMMLTLAQMLFGARKS
jgi:hypothetical protein